MQWDYKKARLSEDKTNAFIKMFRRSLLVDALAITFGIGAWVSINGLWVELPLVVKETPEGWSLPSYIAIIIQLANIGPILYTLLHLLKPSVQSTLVIYGVVTIGCLASLLLAFFWDRTSIIGTKERSLSLLTLIFFLGLVDCTSSVLYIPYMAFWREIYLPSYMIGEGLSGLLPALIALGQGVGGTTTCENVTIFNETTGETIVTRRKTLPEANFSTDLFFFILFAMMLASSLAFVILENYPQIQRERSDINSLKNTENSKLKANKDKKTITMSPNIFCFLLLLQTWACFLSNGFLPSIQSFSCGPYGDIPYHLSATLSTLINPLAAFGTMILPRMQPKTVGIFTFMGTGLGIYIFITAIMSPTPPLVGYFIGSFLVVSVWVTFSGVITYVRVEIANLMREDGAQPLFWSGVVTQIGSAVGAIISFVLVNKTNIFQVYDPCA